MIQSLVLSLLFLGCPSKPAETGEPPADVDGDGYFVTTDCNDSDPAVHPDAVETCDGIDDDCDGAIDEALLSTFYADADADGHGDPGAATEACTAPSGTVVDATDCDDADPAVHPGATETCNGIDDDCDGSTDAGILSTFYADADADGYGDPGAATEACTAPSGMVVDATDCDDTDPAVHPGVTETCNDLDDDCDGAIDDADPEGALGRTRWYTDADADGFGDPSAATEACVAPAGTVSDATDCDDADPLVHPGGIEVCNGADDDCDDFADKEATDALTWYTDADQDGWGDDTLRASGRG